MTGWPIIDDDGSTVGFAGPDIVNDAEASETAEPTPWAIVDERGSTTNVVLWDGRSDLSLPDGARLVPAEDADPAEPRSLDEPVPLVSPDQWPPQDEQVAAIALLTEDSVGYRAMFELLIAKGVIDPREVAAVQAKALERLAALADDPEMRRAMIAARIDRAEGAR